MSLIDSVKSIFSKKVDPAIFGYFNSSSIPGMGEKDYFQSYRGWVYACVNAIAQPVSTMEISLEKRVQDKWDKVVSHPALDILSNVNDFYTSDDLWFWTESMLKLSGNAFWYLSYTGSTPVEIWPLDPLRVKVNKSRVSYIEGYTFTNETGEKVSLSPSEVIHFKKFNPLNAYRGIGEVAAGALAIETDRYAAEWQRNFFGNSAMPSGLLTSEGKLSQEQYDRVRANWDTKFKGVANAHKLAILEGGLDFKPISPTSKEMQFSESRKAMRDEILATFRVPKVVLGITEDVNLASASASEYTFSKFVIKPEMKFLTGKLNEFYLPLFGLSSKDYRFTFADPVPENIDQKRSDRDSGVKNRYMTPNEARAMMVPPLPPIPGGDEIQPLPQPMQPSNNDSTEESDKNDEGKKIHTHKHIISKKKLFQKPREIKVKIHSKVSKQRAYTQHAIDRLQKIFVGLNEELKTMLLKTLIENKEARRAVAKGRMLWKKEEAANQLVRMLFQNYNDWVALVLNATKEGMTKIMADSGKEAIVETNVDVDFDLENPRAVEWLRENALRNATSYTDTMKESISNIIVQSVEAGQSVDQLAADLGQFFSDEEEWRAERLARTETIDAYSAGNLEGYKQSGVVSQKEWLIGGDNESCDICVANADQGAIDLDDTFESGDDAPTAHPNCECALQPITVNDLIQDEE